MVLLSPCLGLLLLGATKVEDDLAVRSRLAMVLGRGMWPESSTGRRNLNDGGAVDGRGRETLSGWRRQRGLVGVADAGRKARVTGSLHSAFFVGGLATSLPGASQVAAALDVLEGLFPAVGLDVGALFNHAHSQRGQMAGVSGSVCSLHRQSRGERWEEEAISCSRLDAVALSGGEVAGSVVETGTGRR